jgi:hypothetical protein
MFSFSDRPTQTVVIGINDLNDNNPIFDVDSLNFEVFNTANPNQVKQIVNQIIN